MELERKMSNKDGVGIIQTDLLFDILIRLPAKSLGRFKVVSKPWQSLIEDRNFVHSHYRRSQEVNDTSRQYLMVELNPYNKEEEGGKAKCYKVDKYDRALEVKGQPLLYKAKAFCNGMFVYLGMHQDLHVVNPITQQALTLPKPQCFGTGGKRILSRNRRHALGFGFDSVSSKYKVVIVVSGITETSTGSYRDQLAEMFTLGSESNSWKKIDSSILYTRVPFAGEAVYVNGASHWKSSCWEDDIVSFNFTQEKFGVIPVRRDMDKFFSNTFDHKWRLCKKREHLCVIGIVAAFGVSEVKLWTLTNYDDATPEWVVQEIIMPYKLIEKHVGFITAATGDDELWIVCCDMGTEVYKTYRYSYNEHGAVVNSREVCHFPQNYGFTGFHLESLVNPKDV